MVSPLSSVFNVHPTERVAVFIDGRNLAATAKQLGIQMDYKRLRDVFSGTRFGRLNYYTLTPSDPLVICPYIQLLDWLRFNGFSVFEKPAVSALNSNSGYVGLAGTVIGEMTVGMLSAASAVDHMILFSGNSELIAAVRAARQKNVKVTVVSSMKTCAGSISASLRSEADGFVELDDIRHLIERTPVATCTSSN